MNNLAFAVECAGIKDIPSMLSLEKRYFDSCWHTEPAFISKLIAKEPMMFRVCKINGRIKGYYWVIPLDYSVWKKVLTGEMNESEAMKHIKSFNEPNLYLYICSVIVDLEDKQHKKYTRALVRDFGRHFVPLKEVSIPDISAIGAFTISEGGRRLLERSNFDYRGSFKADGKSVRAYAIDSKTLAKQTMAARQKVNQKDIA